MRIDIITIFPKLFENFLSEALVSRAIQKEIISVGVHNLRDWTSDNHKTVDDRPFGGGVGMVLMVEPILKAVEALRKIRNPKSEIRNKFKTQDSNKALKTRIIAFSAKGKTFNQATARRLSKYDQLIFICGRYEGIDERVNKYIADEEISIGDFVLFGGEVPAMVVTEAVTRLLPDAVGKKASVEEESFRELSKTEKETMDKFVEYPYYTRPEKIIIDGKNRVVPKVLLSGNHKKIEEWKKKESAKNSKN